MRARTSEPGLVIDAQNLSKTYDFYRQPQGLSGAIRSLLHRELTSVRAVGGLDLSVKRGEIVGLLGPNGAGKTTVVKMLCGLLVPTGGSLSVCGHQPWDRSHAFLSQISVIFGQKAMLWWDVSTRESLKIHRSMYEISPSDFAAIVRDLGDLLGITEILDTPVRNLSLGQRMRCELALALLHRPTLLFADEPTIGLDVEAKLVVRNLFRDINRTFGTTIVLTSHDMNDVEALSERAVIIKGGLAAFDGNLSDLRAHADIPNEIVLTYRDAPQLPPKILQASIENGSHSVRLRLGDEPIAELVQCCPALKVSTKPALAVRMWGCEKTPPVGVGRGSWCLGCRFGVQSAVTSATAARAEDSSTMDLLAVKAATRDWMARLLTARG